MRTPSLVVVDSIAVRANQIADQVEGTMPQPGVSVHYAYGRIFAPRLSHGPTPTQRSP